MLRDSSFFASFASRDISRAATFYRETLGIEAYEEKGMLTLCSPDGNRILIYPKPSHRPAEHTVLNFLVPDIDMAVDALAAKGIRFEQYDGKIQTDAKGISRGNPQVAWFRDPDGNILSIVTKMT
jgi:catechol 2,3-dioxygenase-like lactoylglutathione lyase family enzyme